MAVIVRDDGGEIIGTAGADTITGTGPLPYLVSALAGADTIVTGDGDDTVDAGPGNDSVLGLVGDDDLAGSAGNDFLDGGSGDDLLRGGDGVDSLLGGEGADDLFGGSEDDTLEGGAGDDYLDGGFGADMAVFPFARAEVRIDRFEGDALVIAPDGTDRTSSVETFVFTDGEVVLAELTEDDALTVEEARTVAYLYEAGLDRDGDIDEPGLNFWIDQREAGMSEAELSLAFLLSAEFEAAFGNPVDPEAPDYLEDEELVATLYENVLDREADEAGLAFWLDLLQQDDVSRADLLLAFAVSEENMEGSPHVETLEKVEPGEWAFV